ncbi:MAG: glycoside hydrolase family 2 TIM barrel-domain containing protein [Saccharofermentanales bacterium]|jgi:beta-galactosidase/beta-glucuronidase
MKANLYPGRETLPDWNNPDVSARDRMPPRANLISFPDFNSCRDALTNNRRYLSPHVIMLNENWESRYYPDILQMPESILSFRSGFEPMTVPVDVQYDSDQVQEQGSYPFPVTPPWVPAHQPVLVCRRTVRLPITWGNVRKRLMLMGVSTACHVFVNGHLAGFTQGSALPAEFDITNNLHEGDNEIFVLIYSRCTGSYLEKPLTRLPRGLIRDVWLEAVPPITIHDLVVRPSRQEGESHGWQLDIKLTLISYRIAMDSPTVRLSLWKDDLCIEKSERQVSLKLLETNSFAAPVQTTGELAICLFLSSVHSWSDETPEMYDLFVSVDDRNGQELVCVHQSIGFREIKFQDGRIRINDRATTLRAAIWPGTSLPVPIGEMITTLKTLKNNHLNALYVRDYPADPILLELCDIYGVLVIDEAPLDLSHPMLADALLNESYWLQAAEERLERLIRRDINHACVVAWSAGLFRHSGLSPAALIRKIRSLDQSRPIHLIDTPDIAQSYDAYVSGTIPETDARPWPAVFSEFGDCYYHLDEQDISLLRELRQLLKPVEIEMLSADAGAFLIKNKHHWLGLNNYFFDWRLFRNGRLLLAGALDNIRAGPGDEQFVELIYGDLSFDDQAEYTLRFEVARANTSLWGTCGEEAFFQEFTLAAADRLDLTPTGRNRGRLRMEADRHHLIVSGSRFWFVFNRMNGSLESWRVGEKEIIAAQFARDGCGLTGIQPTIWRSTDRLDKTWLPEWQRFGFDRTLPQVISCQSDCDGQSAVVEMIIRMAAPGKPALFDAITRYDVRSAGDLRIFAGLSTLQDDLPRLPCFGFTINFSKTFDCINWLGGGPLPGLYTLHDSPRHGLYERKGGDPLADCGGLFPDVNWLSVKDGSGLGLMIQSGRPFDFSIVRSPPTPTITGLTNQAMVVQLCQADPDLTYETPLKSVWHLYPIVSDQ